MRRPKLSKYEDYERAILFPVFSNFKVTFVFTRSFDKSARKRFGKPAPDGCDAFHHFNERHGQSTIFLKIGECPTGSLAHECYHAAYAMLARWAGVKKVDEEVMAYHLGYIVQTGINFRNDLIDYGIIETLGVKSKKR